MKRRTMFILLLTLFLLFLAAASIFLVSVDPKIKKRNDALTMMAPTVEFSKVTKFYLFNTDTSFYTVMGENKEGNAIYAIIPEEGGDVTILQQSAVVNEQEARSITLQDKPDVEVLEARLGLLNGEPVWEVNYRMSNQRIGYYYISAKNGKWIKDIENI